MSNDQQAARVNVSDNEWIDFRTLAMRRRRSIADYLGELVRRELNDPPRQPAVEEPRPARRRSSAPVRLSEQKLLTRLPGSERKSSPGRR